MACDLLDHFKLYGLNLSKDAYLIIILINVINVVLGSWPSSREEIMLPCKESMQDMSLLFSTICAWVKKKLPKPMKLFGNSIFFKIVISAQSIRWNLSALSNPNPVLLRPIDVLCPAPNGAEWKLSCITHVFASLFAALSVHQLAAQGEMLYLATRIEQGETEKAWMSTFLLWHLHTLLHLTFSLKLHLKKSPIVEQVDAIWGTCSLQIWAVVSFTYFSDMGFKLNISVNRSFR